MLTKASTRNPVLGQGKEKTCNKRNQKGASACRVCADAGKGGGIMRFGKKQAARMRVWMRLKEGSTQTVP